MSEARETQIGSIRTCGYAVGVFRLDDWFLVVGKLTWPDVLIRAICYVIRDG